MPSSSQRAAEPGPRRAAVESGVLRATEAMLAGGASFAELGVERIATAAGISRTAFYFYFRDKRELLVRLTEDVAGLLYSEAERWWQGEGDGREQLRAALPRILALYAEHRAVLRAVVGVAAVDEEIASAWRALIGRFVEATRTRIELEQAAGRVDGTLPAEPVAFALCWMTERACYEQLERGGELGEEQFLRGLEAIWFGAVYGREPAP